MLGPNVTAPACRARSSACTEDLRVRRSITAYVISDVVRRDPELVGRYRKLARDSIARYDGWYLSNAGAEIDHVENDRAPKNIIVVAFPSMARAREWYQSVEYSRP